MRTFLRKLGQAVARDAIDDVGAMMAYYAVLAAVPMLLFVVTLATLLLPAHTLVEGARLALDTAPSSARLLVESHVDTGAHTRAGFAFSTAVFGVWGASCGASGLTLALNRLFGKVETRSWLHRQAIAIALTAGLAVLLVIALGLLVVGPIIGNVVAERLGLGGVLEVAWTVGRWMGAGLVMLVVWALVYRFLPDTDAPLRIFTPGAAVSVSLWLGISWLFGFYLDHFGHYASIYGAIGGIVIFLTWLWLSSMLLLLGAQINKALTDAGLARPWRRARVATPG